MIATMFKAQAKPSPQLCDHCRKKAKYGGYPYCSRTCAKEASSAASSKLCIQCHQRPKFQGFDFCGKTCAGAARATKPSQGLNQQQKQQANTTRTAAPQPQNSFSRSQARPTAALTTVPVIASATPASVNRSPPIKTSTPPPTKPPKCRMDECWEPVETDMQGFKISDYCSQEHAEDAVLCGLAKGCVMCLRMPQSDSDYFCSRACKDESMHK